MKTTFMSAVSHELRTPITICRGHLEVLGEDPLPDDARATIDLVLDELDRMARLVDDMLLLAKAEQPDFLRLAPVRLQVLSHQLITKLSSLAQRNWILDEVVDGEVLMDRHRITEAIANLAANAVQHTDPDDTIAVGATMHDGDARIWVRDTGTGIAISDQARIFGRFTRGRGAPRRYRGSGLGLAIVRAIAEAHGGRVELESRVGVGSTFTIVLPNVPEEKEPDVEDPDR
jgi:signal transduction histidine kinase